ncbi:MAG TPA: metallophosphoesterase [Sedimentisphaerales bacterium]|nr:metallophosphoesterase [Sedimentisphaerales bacterium]HNU29266.1 metallophosphoesterase [Sedimentisphaerales bacterium]
MNRRRFLKGGLAWAVGVAALGPTRLLGDDRDECTRWAFLSDTHVAPDPDNRYRGFYPYRNLREIAGQIAYNPPDGVIVTGDLARLRGQTAAYENLKTLLTPVTEQRPVYLGLGNHDKRNDFTEVFGGSADVGMTVEDKCVAAAVAGPMRLIVLDSLIMDRAAGLLGRPQRTWLKNFLEACDDRPTILFFHHRPRIDLLDTRRLFDIIAPCAKVKAVVYGHSHKFRFSQYKGIHLINLPATGYNMSGKQPVGWIEARLTDKGGQFTLHALWGNRKLNGCTENLCWRS